MTAIDWLVDMNDQTVHCFCIDFHRNYGFDHWIHFDKRTQFQLSFRCAQLKLCSFIRRIGNVTTNKNEHSFEYKKKLISWFDASFVANIFVLSFIDSLIVTIFVHGYEFSFMLPYNVVTNQSYDLTDHQSNIKNNLTFDLLNAVQKKNPTYSIWLNRKAWTNCGIDAKGFPINMLQINRIPNQLCTINANEYSKWLFSLQMMFVI